MTVCEFRFDDFRLLPAARELWRGAVREKPPRLESNDDLPESTEPVSATCGIDPEDIPF